MILKPKLWKVETVKPKDLFLVRSLFTLAFMSLAALFVNVTAKILREGMLH